ncbi:MAG: ABC transporter permease, partial [Pseudomonadota bacterium]
MSVAALLRTDWFGLLVAFCGGAIALSLTQPTFLSSFNVYVMLTAFSLAVLVALSQMVILAIGQLNLSVGAIGGLAAVTFAGTMEVWGLPIPLAVLAGLLVGLVAGALNGAITHWSGLNAFVVTLATLSIFKGMTIGITEAQPFYDIPQAVKDFGTARVGFFPLLLIVAGGFLIAMFVFMRRAVLGRQLLAVGGNRHAAELSGIDV